MIKVTIGLTAPDSALAGYGASAVVHLQRSVDEAFSAPVDVGEPEIVASKYSYDVWDPDGSSTSWYRWRLESADDMKTGEWSDPFQGVDPAVAARQSGSYATVDDVLITMGRRPTTAETERLLRIERALVKTRELIDLELGTDFFRHPASGSESWIVDARGGSLLHVHDGIASLDSVEVRDSITGTWTLVDASDWLLEPAQPALGVPYFHVQLTGAVSRGTWPSGSRLVRFTGARGWARPHRLAIEGNVDWAKMQLAVDPTGQGGPQGPPDLGRPQGLPFRRMPDAVYSLKRWHVEQFLGCGL